ncbi:MAG TPA: AMP-binding protein, partial [Trebonia sp.]
MPLDLSTVRRAIQGRICSIPPLNMRAAGSRASAPGGCRAGWPRWSWAGGPQLGHDGPPLDQHEVTLVAGVPPLRRRLAEAAVSRPTRRIGYLTAGMPLDPRTAELVGTVLGGRLGEVHGTTETGPICVRPPVPWQDARSLGRPLPGVRGRFCRSSRRCARAWSTVQAGSRTGS